MSLLLLFAGATTSAATSPVVGWPSRRRIPRQELDRRLKEQRDNTFSRRRFEELLNAEEELREKARTARNKKQQAALNAAADATEEVIERAKTVPFDLGDITPNIRAAINAKSAQRAIENANMVIASAHAALLAAQEAQERDDEETIMLLLS